MVRTCALTCVCRHNLVSVALSANNNHKHAIKQLKMNREYYLQQQ